MEISLIRHTSVDVPAGVCYGQTDVPLRATFEEEAALVKANIEGEFFDKIYTSPLTRCVRLASFCDYEHAIHEKRIMELNFGIWEMTPFSSLTDTQAHTWFNNWIDTPTPNGESFMNQYQRVSSFLDELKQLPLHKVCIFTHGGVITCARVYNQQYGIQDAFKHIPSYGEIVKIII